MEHMCLCTKTHVFHIVFDSIRNLSLFGSPSLKNPQQEVKIKFWALAGLSQLSNTSPISDLQSPQTSCQNMVGWLSASLLAQREFPENKRILDFFCQVHFLSGDENRWLCTRYILDPVTKVVVAEQFVWLFSPTLLHNNKFSLVQTEDTSKHSAWEF